MLDLDTESIDDITVLLRITLTTVLKQDDTPGLINLLGVWERPVYMPGPPMNGQGIWLERDGNGLLFGRQRDTTIVFQPPSYKLLNTKGGVYVLGESYIADPKAVCAELLEYLLFKRKEDKKR